MGDRLILAVGDLVEDVVVWPVGTTVRGTDNPARIVRARGGSAANVAVFASVLGPAAFVGRVGADASGEALVGQLREHGVDARVQREGRTGTVVVRVEQDGERTMFPDRAAAADLADVPPEWADGAAAVHVSAYALAAEPSVQSVLGLVRRARAAGALVSVDASSSALLTELGVDRYVELLALLAPGVHFANTAESALVRPAQLVGLGITAVVKDGGGPVVVHRPGHEPLTVEVAPVTGVRDSTGAGDAFAAAYLAARLAGEDDAAAAVAGSALAARVLASPGATLAPA